MFTNKPKVIFAARNSSKFQTRIIIPTSTFHFVDSLLDCYAQQDPIEKWQLEIRLPEKKNRKPTLKTRTIKNDNKSAQFIKANRINLKGPV